MLGLPFLIARETGEDMTRYQTLVQERADLAREGGAIFARSESERRALSADEMARDDAINTRLQEIAPELERIERQRERERATGGGQPIGDAGATTAAVRREASGRLVDASGHPIPKNANGFPRLIPSGGESSLVFESGRDLAASKPWGADSGAPFGEWLQAIHRAGTGRGTDPRLLAAPPGQGMNETVGSDGGFLVQTDMATEIASRMRAGGEILSRVDHLPISANSNGIRINVLDETSRATGSRYGGVQAYWLEEGGTKLASRPRLAQIKLELHKIAALGYSTDELLQDAPALESIMTQAFADELRFMAEDAIVKGDGVGKPLGINSANNPALVSTTAAGGQSAATLLYENIIAMWVRMFAPSRRRAVWLVNQDIEPQLFTMSLAVGVGGVPVYLPAMGAADNPLSTLFGRPVIPVEYAATLGTVGDILLVDLSEYAFIDKGGIQQNSSIHVAFTTDETAFRAVYRCDGAPKWKAPLTPYQGSNSQSPYVALATRA